MRLSRGILGLGALSTLAMACHLIVGIGDDRFTYTPPADAGRSADAAPRDCVHALPPPNSNIPQDSLERDVVLAFRSMSVTGRSAKSLVLGFDLDDHCTCDPLSSRRDSCRLPTKPLRDGGCDDPGGIDNAVAVLGDQATFQALYSLGKVEETLQRRINCGRLTPILVVTKYNGKADDSEVTAGTIPGFGILEAHEDGEQDDAGCYKPDQVPVAPFPAKWDGTDRWSVRENDVDRTLQGRTPLPKLLFQGYVRDYKLVLDGRSGTTPVHSVLFGALMTIQTPLLVGELVPLDASGAPIPREERNTTEATSFALVDGVLAGRVRSDDLLAAIGKSSASLGGDVSTPLCENEEFYGTFKAAICNARDISSLPANDGKGDPCDSLSVGIGFTAARALIGAQPYVVEPKPDDAGCAGFTDNCSGL